MVKSVLRDLVCPKCGRMTAYDPYFKKSVCRQCGFIITGVEDSLHKIDTKDVTDMEDCAKRETTLDEEIDSLLIPTDMKDMLANKLCDERSKREREFKEKMEKLNYELSVINNKFDEIREQNISLKSACFSLAAALKQQYDL